MILRRLADAIREQNWFTVLIEFVIVVAGILVGLQVDDWNQRRLDREHDQRTVALFSDELKQMLSEASEDLIFVNAAMQGLSSGTEIALNCDATDEERARLTTAIANTLQWRVPDIRPSGLAEMSNSGTLARLDNLELTQAVGTINESIRVMGDSMFLIAPQYHRAFEMLLPYLVLTAPIKLEKADLGVVRRLPSEYLSLLPQDKLCSTQEFLLGLSMLTSFYESNVYNFEQWHRTLRRADEFAEGELKL